MWSNVHAEPPRRGSIVRLTDVPLTRFCARHIKSARRPYSHHSHASMTPDAETVAHALAMVCDAASQAEPLKVHESASSPMKFFSFSSSSWRRSSSSVSKLEETVEEEFSSSSSSSFLFDEDDEDEPEDLSNDEEDEDPRRIDLPFCFLDLEFFAFAKSEWSETRFWNEMSGSLSIQVASTTCCCCCCCCCCC